MLSETLRRDASSVEEFAEIVEERTANVPMLVQQFVDHLYDQGSIWHETDTG